MVRGLCGWLAGCCCSARMRAEREEHERKEKECARLRAAQEKVMDRRVRVALPGMHSSVIAPCFTTCHRRVCVLNVGMAASWWTHLGVRVTALSLGRRGGWH